MTPLKHMRFVRYALRISALVTLAGLIAFGCRYVGYSEHVPTVKHGWDREPVDMTATKDGLVLALEYADGFWFNRVKAYRENVFVASLELPHDEFYYRHIDAGPRAGVFWVMGSKATSPRASRVRALRFSIDGTTLRHASTHDIEVPGSVYDFGVAAGTGVYQGGIYVLSDVFNRELQRPQVFMTHDTLPCSGGGGCLRSSVTKELFDQGDPVKLEALARRIAVDPQTGDLHMAIYDEVEEGVRLYAFPRGDLNAGMRGPMLPGPSQLFDLAARGGLLTLAGKFPYPAPRTVRSLVFSGRGYSDVLDEAVDGGGEGTVMAVAGYAHANPSGCEKHGAYIYTYGTHSRDGDRFNKFGRHSFCFTGSPEE